MSSAICSVEEALAYAVDRTFADMAFIDAVPVDQGHEQVSSGQLIHIGFGRPVEGHLTLYMGADLKRLITENIFGQAWEDTEDGIIDDCLLELLNVLAGNFLKALGESEEKHNISLPQLLFDDSLMKETANSNFYSFDAEGHSFGISVGYLAKTEPGHGASQ